jgi:phosphopantothenoylcysteine synthetase/decarboxylase
VDSVSNEAQAVIYVVACGGYVAGQLEDFVQRRQAEGWDVCVIATPAALRFMDTEHLGELTNHVVRSDYKQPNEPDVLPMADAVVVVPATFNTINKLANGISDNVALGVLHEAIGLGLPTIVVPTTNAALGEHPVFRASVETLRSWGVTVLFDPESYPLPAPRTGLSATDFFPWEALEAAMAQVRVTFDTGFPDTMAPRESRD